MFSFRIRRLVCKRKNQSGTKTSWIHHEPGTISSSVNLVLRFRIQNVRRHGQTGMFSFRIRPLVCKRQNQSGTETFRIHNESGTISSSVNQVLSLETKTEQETEK